MVEFRPVNEREVLRLRAQLDAEYKKRVEAIDLVLQMLRSPNGLFPITATQPTPPAKSQPKTVSNTEREPRVRGMLKATRNILNDLPETFTSFQVRDALELARPEFKGRVKLDSLRGVLNTLAVEGYVEQIAAGAGPKPALYKRLKLVEDKM